MKIYANFFKGTLLIGLVFTLTNCATSMQQPNIGEAAWRAEQMVLELDGKLDKECAQREVVKKEEIYHREREPAGVTVTERWTVNRCGSEQFYIARFASGDYADGAKGVNISIKPESGKIPESIHVEDIAVKSGCELKGAPQLVSKPSASPRIYEVPCTEQTMKFECGRECFRI